MTAVISIGKRDWLTRVNLHTRYCAIVARVPTASRASQAQSLYSTWSVGFLDSSSTPLIQCGNSVRPRFLRYEWCNDKENYMNAVKLRSFVVPFFSHIERGFETQKSLVLFS